MSDKWEELRIYVENVPHTRLSADVRQLLDERDRQQRAIERLMESASTPARFDAERILKGEE